MKRTDADNHVENLFQSGDPLTGQRGTRLEHTWLNAVQEELASAIEAAGIVLDPTDNSQLSAAIRKISLASFTTRDAAIATNGAALLPADIESIYVKGHSIEGIGAADYKRVAVEPTHDGKFQDAAAQWWELSAFEATPEMFGALEDGATDDEAAMNAVAGYCIATGAELVLAGDNYRTTATVNFRHVRLRAPHAIIIADHDDIGVILGGNSSNPNNPTQIMGRIVRGASHTATAAKECRIIGAKGQHITLLHCDRCEIYADTDDPQGGSSAYSSFWFKNVFRVYLDTNPTTSGTLVQWINENKFYLNRTLELYIDGTYNHNHNIFEGGNFEGGGGIIRMTKGRMNIVRNVRAEGGMQEISFGANTEGNMVVGSWWGSGLRLIGPELRANVTDNGNLNVVTTEQAIAMPLRLLCGFTHESLIESAPTSGKFNIAQVSGVTLGALDFTVGSFVSFYDSKRMPVAPLSDVFEALLEGVTSGGVRIVIFGYDSAGNALSSTGSDIHIDGSGAAGFSANVPTNNTSSKLRFWITNPNCAYAIISCRAGGSGLIAEEFALSVHSNDQTRAIRMVSATSTPNI